MSARPVAPKKARRERAVSNRAPITYERCPCHGQLVGLDGDGRLLGKCWGCVQEAARAKAILGRRNHA